jgi:iron(III) transport system substrate-binding protein
MSNPPYGHQSRIEGDTMNHHPKSGARRLLTLVGALTVVCGTLAACGGDSTTAADLPTSMDELVKQAEDEGEVDWSAPKPIEQMQPAIDLFEEKYPGIEVKYTNTKAPDQVSQIKVEQAARKVSVDVANAGGLTVVPSLDLADDVSWADYGIDDENIFEKKMVYIWAVPKVWAYNTDKVAAGDVPTSWDDLLDPEWSGTKVSAEARASFLTVWDLDSSLGQEKAEEWGKEFAGQDPHFTPTTTESHALIESGQVEVGTSLINLVLEAQAKGAPVDIAPISPTNANESYLYVPEGAPHPAAAVLLTSFLSSDEAQDALAKTYNSRIPVDTDCSEPGENAVLQAICDAGLEWAATPDISAYQDLTEFFPAAEKAMGTNAN